MPMVRVLVQEPGGAAAFAGTTPARATWPAATMTTFHFLLTLLFGAALLGWLGLAAYVVGGRAAHDLRARRLAEAEARSSGRGLSRRALRRAALDASLAPHVSLLFAFEEAATVGTGQLVARAGRHRTELDKWRRIEALRILALVADPAALPLLELALRADEDVAAAAAAILGSLRSEAAAEVLAAAIGRSQLPDSKLSAYLDSYPLDVPGVVRRLACDRSPARRYRGVSLLARYIERGDARQLLCAAAGDVDADVRAAVAEALGSAGEGGIDELDALARDTAWFVRAHAARSLGARRYAELGAVVAPLLADESWWVRAAAKDALGELGPDAAAAVAPYLHSSDRFARNGAVEVLERIGHVDLVLVEAVAAPYDVLKQRAAQAIIAASADAYRAAVERATPELREALLVLVEPVGVAA